MDVDDIFKRACAPFRWGPTADPSEDARALLRAQSLPAPLCLGEGDFFPGGRGVSTSTHGSRASREALISSAAGGLGRCGLRACPRQAVRDAALRAGATPPALAMCSRCKLAAYCSMECQRADYPAHREPCKRAVAGGGADAAAFEGPSPASVAFHQACVRLAVRASGALALLHAVWSEARGHEWPVAALPPLLHVELARDEPPFTLPCAWRVSALGFGLPGRVPPRANDWLRANADVRLYMAMMVHPAGNNAPYDGELRSGVRVGLVFSTPNRARVKLMSLKHGVPVGALRARVRELQGAARRGMRAGAPLRSAAAALLLTSTHLVVSLPPRAPPPPRPCLRARATCRAPWASAVCTTTPTGEATAAGGWSWSRWRRLLWLWKRPWQKWGAGAGAGVSQRRSQRRRGAVRRRVWTRRSQRRACLVLASNLASRGARVGR